MAEPFRRLKEVDEVLVTGKGIKGLLRNIRWSRRAKADVYLVPFPSNRWQYSMLALTSGAKRKVLHGYPVGRIRAMGFIGERMPATERFARCRAESAIAEISQRAEPDERRRRPDLC